MATPGPKVDAGLARLASTIEAAWEAIRRARTDVPSAVIVIGAGRGLGHFARGRWEVSGRLGVAEVAVSKAGLLLDPEELFHVLLHEAAHGVCATRALEDTSRNGRYHNSVFAAVATEVGLGARRSDPHGFRTDLPPRVVQEFSEAIAAIGAAQRVRPSSQPTEPYSYFTVGYGGHTPTTLVDLLTGRGVRTVADIRIWPIRAQLGSFVQARDPDRGISGLLGRSGISYRWAPSLGNPWFKLPGSSWADPYRRLLARAGDLLTLDLEDLEGPWALLCSEADHHGCHRGLVAEHLAATRGWVAVHL